MPRKKKDPLVMVITDSVIWHLRNAVRPDGGKPMSHREAVAEVGGDGIAYLRKMVEVRVAEGKDRAALEAHLLQNWINPAKRMLDIPLLDEVL